MTIPSVSSSSIKSLRLSNLKSPVKTGNNDKATRKKSDVKTKPNSNLELARNGLLKLSAELKANAIDKEEAHRRFCDLVLRESLSDKLRTKDYEELVRFVSDFFIHDPTFKENLIKSLKSYC